MSTEPTDGRTHVLEVWAVDPEVVVQELVLDLGGALPSNFGPPESLRTGLD